MPAHDTAYMRETLARKPMRKVIYLLCFFILILGCKAQNKSTDRIDRCYPDPEIFKQLEKTSFIALDSVENYGRLLEVMDRITCNEIAPILQFSDQMTNYNLLSFIECSQSNSVADYFRKNEIRVENDSIFSAFEKGKITADFEEILKTIISEPISYMEYGGDTLKPALIFFYADQDYPIEKIKGNLIKIISDYEGLKSSENGEFPFAILFERNKFIPPPSK